MQSPFFSVITATHLRAGLLQRALASLLQQTFTDFEIIVVADALDNGTATVAAQLLRDQDIFIKRNGVAGPAASRNLGIAAAQGDWLLFLDDDDTIQPHHLEVTKNKIVSSVQSGETQAKVFYSDFSLVTENRTHDPIVPLSSSSVLINDRNPFDLYVKNFIPNNALIYHRTILDHCRFDPCLESQEDWDFLLSVCRRSMPTYYSGGGAVVHKDYENPGTRRGTQTAANDNTVIVDFLHVYRRCRAPSTELQNQRQALMKSVGMDLPSQWF